MANTFVFTEIVNAPPPKVVSAALGVDADNKFAMVDIGKAVKMASGSKYLICVEDDEIEGFVNSIEPETVSSGLSFGGVRITGRKVATVGAHQGGVPETPMAVGDYVVADDQVALGTAGNPVVKTGTPAKFLWRCIRIITGAGAPGSTVLLERI